MRNKYIIIPTIRKLESELSLLKEYLEKIQDLEADIDNYEDCINESIDDKEKKFYKNKLEESKKELQRILRRVENYLKMEEK